MQIVKSIKTCLYLLIMITVFPSTAQANYQNCVVKEKNKWEKKRAKNPAIIIEDAIINNPSNSGTGFPTVTIPIPNFKKLCAERIAKRYSFYHLKNWKWFLKEQGAKRRTIDTQISINTNTNLRLKVRSFDANQYGKPQGVRLYYTDAFGKNRNIENPTSSYSGLIKPKIYQRTKIGNFKKDTIVFFKGEFECPIGRVCPE